MRYFIETHKKLLLTLTIIIAIITVGSMSYVILRHTIFKDPNLGYYIVSENYTGKYYIGVVCDGEYLYDFTSTNNEDYLYTFNKRYAVTENSTPAIRLYITTSNYTLESKKLNRYKGSVQDISAYILKLVSSGYKVESFDVDYKHYDITLVDNPMKVRIILDDTENIKIFAVDGLKNSTAPPYINSKENK